MGGPQIIGIVTGLKMRESKSSFAFDAVCSNVS